MRNKFSYIILAMLMCFSFLESVNASEIEVTASANKTTVVKGEEVTISVNVKADKPIFSCTIDVVDTDDFRYIDGSVGKLGFATTVSDLTNNSRRILVEGDTNGENATNGLKFLEFKYIVSNSGTITISPKNCSVVENSSSNEIEISDDIEIQMTANDSAPTEDTTLSNISVRGGKILNEGGFKPSDSSIMIQVDSSTFGLTLTATNSDFQNSIVVKDSAGKEYDDLSNIIWNDPSGQKMMRLLVYINNEQKYELVIVYEAGDLDNSLETLTVNGQNIELKPGVFEYKVTIPNNVTSFKLDATLKDSNNFQITGVTIPGTFNVTGDTTYVALVIEPKDSTIAAEGVTYSLEVIQEGGKPSGSGNNNGGNSGGSSTNSGNNANKNPQTGDISMFVMLIVLISSLVGSVILYQKNLENYR
jgi:hypothetical protein